MEWMILPLRRYADFSGRSRRKEYWLFFLFNFVVQIILSLIDSALGLGGQTTSYSTHAAGGFATGAGTSGGLLSGIYSLAVLVPSIAVGVRRLHDIDRTGWWLLGIFVPFLIGAGLLFSSLVSGNGSGAMWGSLMLFIGGIFVITLFVWACFDGTNGPNRFGPDPKGGMDDLHETFR